MAESEPTPAYSETTFRAFLEEAGKMSRDFITGTYQALAYGAQSDAKVMVENDGTMGFVPGVKVNDILGRDRYLILNADGIYEVKLKMHRYLNGIGTFEMDWNSKAEIPLVEYPCFAPTLLPTFKGITGSPRAQL